MRTATMDAFTRQATAVVSRRSSLLALSATALTAALSRPSAAEAGGCGRKVQKVKDKCRRIISTRCRRQRTQCFNATNAFCNGNLGCIAATGPCCRLLDTHCDATSAVECLLAANV